MKTTRSILAVLALATGSTVAAGSDAWAWDPDKETPVRFETVTPATPVTSAPQTSARLEVAQTGASALGGAGVAFAAMWVYRRRVRLV